VLEPRLVKSQTGFDLLFAGVLLQRFMDDLGCVGCQGQTRNLFRSEPLNLLRIATGNDFARNSHAEKIN